MCPKAYGCAFDEILTDPRVVYIKLDDDIIFIKDGSFEHLVYQVSGHGVGCPGMGVAWCVPRFPRIFVLKVVRRVLCSRVLCSIAYADHSPQTLFNSDYLFYSGSVVNNPHGYAIHAFNGAYPPTTYHWKALGQAHPPFVNESTVVEQYYGKNIYDQVCWRVQTRVSGTQITVCALIAPTPTGIIPSYRWARKRTRHSFTTPPRAVWTCTHSTCGT